MEQSYLNSPVYHELGGWKFHLSNHSMSYDRREESTYPIFNYSGKDIVQIKDSAFSSVKFSDSQNLLTLIDVEYISKLHGAVCVIQTITDASQLLDCVQKVKLVRQANPTLEIMLYVPYLLGGRSDRQFSKGQLHYLRDVIAPTINALNLSTIFFTDPHSDVTEAVFHCKTVNLSALPGMIHTVLYDALNCYENMFSSDSIMGINYEYEDQLRRLIFLIKGTSELATVKSHKVEGFPSLVKPSKVGQEKRFLFIAPDAGAVKRLEIALDHLKNITSIQSIWASNDLYELTDNKMFGTTHAIKHRNVATGKIDSVDLAISPEELNTYTDIIVVDDLCDGGGTFEELIANIRGAKYQFLANSYLIVPHAIFSRTDVINKFTKVYVTNSFTSFGALIEKNVRDLIDRNFTVGYSALFNDIKDAGVMSDKVLLHMIKEMSESRNMSVKRDSKINLFDITSSIKF